MRIITMAAALVAAIAAGSTMVAAQKNPAPAGLEQRSYDVASFDRIAGMGPHDFIVSVGSGFSVRAEGPAESLEKYEVVVEDGALSIRPPRKYWREGDWEEFQVEPATYYITLPRLEGAMLAGSGTMTIDRIAGEDFAASLAGSGRLEIGGLSVTDARLAVAGSGKLSAAGAAREAHVSIAGSGNLEALRMTSDIAKISIAGSGKARLTVNDEAHMSVVGSGDVEISGDASCTVSGFGSGRARCKDGVHETSEQWREWSGADDARYWREWAHAWDGWADSWSGWEWREED